MTFVGVDSEAWNSKGTGGAALFKVGKMGALRLFSMNGGNLGSPYPTPAFDVAADEFQIYNNVMRACRSGIVDCVLRPGNLRSLLVNSPSPRVYDDKASNAFRTKAFEAGSTDFEVNGTAQSSLTAGQQAMLSAMVFDKRPGKPWEAPRYGAIPDPAGPAWKQNLAGKPDNTDYIQGLIDANGVARLPAGIYYISRPLKVKTGGGLIGAGADKTAIIAMNGKLDLIVANDKDARLPTGRKIILSGLTLQGGANGVHFEPVGTGTKTAEGNPIRALNPDGTPKVKPTKSNSKGNPYDVYVQYTACYFNDVTFRNMSVAGIFMDQIFGLDNIFVSYLNFVNCDAGWKQKVDPAYTSPVVNGTSPTMMYMDKVLFYRCQFADNRIAMDLPGNRSCNLNAWVNCKFGNNREGVAAMTSYESALFANCDFINNGGTAVVSNDQPLSFVSCRFRAGSAGVAMFKGPVSAEGCSFDRDGSAGATILRPGANNVKVFFINCISNDMPLGLTPKISGMLVNSVMVPSDQVNQRMVLIKGGSVRPILNETTTGTVPVPQLLFGSDWSEILN
ncbi:MAG: glycoside hydrolase family 55 protein [Bacteroidetes bacterium]|nr:glycoside hydrolase family 55 protein [Bacteroidota bacterium]